MVTGAVILWVWVVPRVCYLSCGSRPACGTDGPLLRVASRKLAGVHSHGRRFLADVVVMGVCVCALQVAGRSLGLLVPSHQNFHSGFLSGGSVRMRRLERSSLFIDGHEERSL